METVNERDGPELVFGLVAAVGTDLGKVSELLTQELRRASYKAETIRLSALLLACERFRSLREKPPAAEDERIDSFMDAGDALRKDARRGDAVAILGISRIRQFRLEIHGDVSKPLPGQAYILNSLKHPSEIEILREAYGDAFFVLSVYAPKFQRNDTLCERIAKSRNVYAPENFREQALRLIEKDEKEIGEDDYGQNVRDLFPEGDVFIDASDSEKIGPQIERFIDILFGHPYMTPTVSEYGMFHAKAAALRSADLSRQVGAIIATDEGEIISTGCNEVPRAGGGSVWEGRVEEREDYRDFRIGYDATARMKHEMLSEIFENLRREKWFSGELAEKTSDQLVDLALYSGRNPPLKGTRVASIIEFGRIVHAEMSAITDAARRGLAVKGAILYCTTFPCHMCARHLIAAGISEVVYIEPYPKSMTKELYKRTVCVDHDPEADAGAVVFKPFFGISPLRFIDFFEMTKRKDARGYALTWQPSTGVPRVKQYPLHTDIEAGLINFLTENSVKLGITAAEGESKTMSEENWLHQQLRQASKEVSGWSDWKKEAMRLQIARGASGNREGDDPTRSNSADSAKKKSA